MKNSVEKALHGTYLVNKETEVRTRLSVNMKDQDASKNFDVEWWGNGLFIATTSGLIPKTTVLSKKQPRPVADQVEHLIDGLADVAMKACLENEKLKTRLERYERLSAKASAYINLISRPSASISKPEPELLCHPDEGMALAADLFKDQDKEEYNCPGHDLYIDGQR